MQMYEERTASIKVLSTARGYTRRNRRRCSRRTVRSHGVMAVTDQIRLSSRRITTVSWNMQLHLGANRVESTVIWCCEVVSKTPMHLRECALSYALW